jgi:nucleoside-diphosphate-sugar epimerase
MKVLVTGGGGFLGQKLARSLAAGPALCGRRIEAMTLADIVAPAAPAAPFPVECRRVDISYGPAVLDLFRSGFDAVFHLAAAVSGECEADFDLGMRVNLIGTINVLEAARASGRQPVLVFTSSWAAHGGEAPETVTDGTPANPQTSYGAQKVACEYLITDMSRKGFLDGRALRLPTVTIRPGKANAAASSFMSSVFRDTLEGRSANCPVGRDFPIWYSAPRTVVRNLRHAAEIPAADWGANGGTNRAINLPGRSEPIGDMIGAMTRVAGPEAEARITWNADPVIGRIVKGWRGKGVNARALALGFAVDASFEDNVRWFIADDIRRA